MPRKNFGLPEVAEATVLGVDDEQYGQRLVAFVVLTDGSAVTEDALKQHVRDNLANYKVPRSITVLGELPRNSTGKIENAQIAEANRMMQRIWQLMREGQ